MVVESEFCYTRYMTFFFKQVPDVVNEQARYGGELTGIRANLSRSIKIK